MSQQKTSFVYVTYIRSTPEKVFEAITKPYAPALRTTRSSPGFTSASSRSLAKKSPLSHTGPTTSTTSVGRRLRITGSIFW